MDVPATLTNPAYSVAEAARFVGVSPQTVANWVRGYKLPGGGKAAPLTITRASRLSFLNLVEVHILRAFRRVHGVPMQRVRKAVERLRRKYDQRWPLASSRLLTDGLQVILEHGHEFRDVSANDQLVLRNYVQMHTRRVEFSPAGLPLKLFPLMPSGFRHDRLVCLDPAVRFGFPAVRGVPTQALVERADAGEDYERIATDFGLQLDEVEEAVQWEKTNAAA